MRKIEIIFRNSSSWTIPSSVTSIAVDLVGGGGSGAILRVDGGQGGGGGGGGRVTATVDNSLLAGDTLSIAVGLGGLASSVLNPGPGTPGGNSRVTGTATPFDLIADGGQGAHQSDAVNVLGGGGSASGATTAEITPGQGSAGVAGGGSFYGAGGYSTVVDETVEFTVPSLPGGFFGGGGAGQTNNDFTNSSTNGGDGIVIITYIERVDI